MQIVIDIPEHLIELAQKELIMGGDMPTIANAISNGVVLPKEHGHLIDISNIDAIELEDSVHCMRHVKGDEVDVDLIAPIVLKGTR